MLMTERINASFPVSPPSPLVAVYPMPRPPLDPLTNVGHRPPAGSPATFSDKYPSRRQSSISYLPQDSPRLWSPRSPLTGSLERRLSLSGANSPKECHSRTRSVSQRAISEPAVLTLAERYVSRPHFTTRVHSCMVQLKIHFFSQ